jgi:EAL domain-containing protein (putative c-di-GMP-specific phosphodiesterase class I)
VTSFRVCAGGIAIDDFGTGYSSLSYLRASSVSHIKIAQEFVQHLKPNSGDATIVRAAIDLSHALGIQVIAVGVETEFQLGLLSEAGCELIQGYYYSPPVPATQMTELLRQRILRPAAAPDLLGDR